MIDFFISYTSVDSPWATWIAWQLEEAGYATILQDWDFRPGSNFVLEMQKAAKEAERTIAVLSNDYFSARYTASEWAAAFAQDPTGEKGKLVLVRVRKCDVEGILGPMIYIDLVDLEEKKARSTLITGLHLGRAKPKTPPPFPQRSITEQPKFPSALKLFNIPYEPNPYFLGRDTELDQLRRVFITKQRGGRVQAITGIGGIGKTQIALQYTYLYRDYYDAVFWVKGDTETALMSGFATIAQLLELIDPKESDQEQAVVAAKNWLAENSKWLLVIDRADQPDLVRKFCSSNAQGHILLTSRADVIDILGIDEPIKISPLSLKKAVTFLLRRTGRQRLDRAELRAASELSEELGCLPLALEQAGAYIKSTKTKFQKYLVSYRNFRQEILEKSQPVYGDYHASVFTTWTLNFRAVEKNSPASSDLLRASAFLHPDGIPLELLERGASQLGPTIANALAQLGDEPTILDNLLAQLTRYSLIWRDSSKDTYNIHRLVQEVQRQLLDQVSHRLWAERIVRAVNQVCPMESTAVDWSFCTRLLPQLQAAAILVEDYQFQFTDAITLLQKASFHLYEHAQYLEARRLVELCLSFQEKLLGAYHPSLIASLNLLAAICDILDQPDEGTHFARRAIQLSEKNLGLHNDQTARSYYHLAILELGKYNYLDAETHFKTALFIWEAASTAKPLDVANCRNYLAKLYHDQASYDQAKHLYTQALAIRQQVLGKHHPTVAETLNNLGLLAAEQADYSAAKECFHEALAIWEQTCHLMHPDAAVCLYNRGQLAFATRDYHSAESDWRKAWSIRERIFGDTHPAVAESLNNFGLLRMVQSDFLEAEQFYKKSIDIWCMNGLQDSLKAAPCLANLGFLYHYQKDFIKAEQFYRKALAIWDKIFQLGHPDSTICLNNLAKLLIDQGRFNESDHLLQQSLRIRQAKFGESHPLVADGFYLLALLRCMEKRWDEAIIFYQRVLDLLQVRPGWENDQVSVYLCEAGHLVGDN